MQKYGRYYLVFIKIKKIISIIHGYTYYTYNIILIFLKQSIYFSFKAAFPSKFINS